MSENITNEAVEAATGAAAVASQVQAAVASQSSVLNKIEAGFQEFLSFAPAVVSAVDPAIGATSTGLANAGLALLAVLKGFHLGAVAPAATSPVTATANPTSAAG